MVSTIRPWSGLSYESLPWTPSEHSAAARSVRMAHRGPYQAALVPPIAECGFDLPLELLAQVADADAEIARFDTEVGHEIMPFASVLLRSESAASSKIERLTASARAIAEAELGSTERRNATLIVANQRAMSAAIALADRIDRQAILDMHKALLEAEDPTIAGRFRDEQVWVGGSDYGPHQALFVPPHARHVSALVDDLIDFIGRDDLPVLAHAALAHAQFETIHPFSDGNGRTGRALVHAQLRHKRLTREVTVPISAGLLTDTESYFSALTAYRLGDAAPIVERFVGASFTAIANGRQLVAELRGVRDGWNSAVRARRGAQVWRVADLLLRHPVINAALVAEELGIAPENTYRIITPLENAGVLVEFTDQKRDRLWRAPDVLVAVDAFALRAGRRQRGAT